MGVEVASGGSSYEETTKTDEEHMLGKFTLLAAKELSTARPYGVSRMAVWCSS
ncbi:MAG: hypothetical protein V3V43_02070 [Dehalococcoidales bacterium]